MDEMRDMVCEEVIAHMKEQQTKSRLVDSLYAYIVDQLKSLDFLF
jgi:hypothetical protein